MQNASALCLFIKQNGELAGNSCSEFRRKRRIRQRTNLEGKLLYQNKWKSEEQRFLLDKADSSTILSFSIASSSKSSKKRKGGGRAVLQKTGHVNYIQNTQNKKDKT